MRRTIAALLAAAAALLAGCALPPSRTPTGGNVRPACLTALRALRRDVGQLRLRHREILGHLAPGVVDERRLSLHFDVADTSKRIIRGAIRGGRPITAPDGLFFQITHPMRLPERRRFQRRWLFINVGFNWSWLWPGSFPAASQAELSDVLGRALRPLDDLENAAIAARCGGGAPYVLRGERGIELTVRLADKRAPDGPHVVELYETNNTAKTVALYPGRPERIVDGKVYRRAPALGLVVLETVGRSRDPFTYLGPGESRKVQVLSFRRLQPGKHSIRVALLHGRDGWEFISHAISYTREHRGVKNAWMGVLVSNRLDVKIERVTKRR